MLYKIVECVDSAGCIIIEAKVKNNKIFFGIPNRIFTFREKWLDCEFHHR